MKRITTRDDEIKLPKWDSRVSAIRKREIIDRVNDYHKQRIKKAFDMSAELFSKVIQSGSLMPFTQESELKTRTGTFDVMSAMVDSGATVPVMNPSTGESYDRRLRQWHGVRN